MGGSLAQLPTRPGHPPLPAGSPGLTPQEREYALMRWRVLMTELHYWADQLGWQGRLPQKPNQP